MTRYLIIYLSIIFLLSTLTGVHGQIDDAFAARQATRSQVVRQAQRAAGLRRSTSSQVPILCGLTPPGTTFRITISQAYSGGAAAVGKYLAKSALGNYLAANGATADDGLQFRFTPTCELDVIATGQRIYVNRDPNTIALLSLILPASVDRNVATNLVCATVASGADVALTCKSVITVDDEDNRALRLAADLGGEPAPILWVNEARATYKLVF